MSLDVWNDRRTGFVGRVAGNAVLAQLQNEDGQPIKHLKGTIFTTQRRIYVGRVCHAEYLQKDVLQFCNLSTQQYESVISNPKEAMFLFITISLPMVKYWVVPSDIIGRVLPTLTPKPDKRTRFLRVTGKNNRHFLGQFDITDYYHELTLDETNLRAISGAHSLPMFQKQTDGTVQALVTLEGRDFQGILSPT